MISDHPKKPGVVAVFGAGIAGLTVAHELVRRGWRVEVYEANPEAGGFFRSGRLRDRPHIPTEYSWHGMGPWYHNLFDILKEIPYDEQGSMYDRALSRPIDFGLAPDEGHAAFDDTRLVNIKNMFRMTWLDVVRGTWLMLKTWAADRRTRESYAYLNAAEQWQRRLSGRASSTWRASFGPWIGSDWTNVSLHTAGQFFRKQLTCKPCHPHSADTDGPAWNHGARGGWLLLRGPSSECWFNRWVSYLTEQGVAFHWEEPLRRFHYDGCRVVGADTDSNRRVTADLYVLATSPFAAAAVLSRTPSLAAQDQLRLFELLIQDGPHVQVSFRIPFAETIKWPRPRTALVLADTEFNLTIFAQEQVWLPKYRLGDGVQSLWTGTACVSTRPGRIHGLPLARCTKQQFVEEVREQLLGCGGLDALIREANGGRGVRDFPMMGIEVWHEWEFSPQGIAARQPKWVNTTSTQRYQPTQITPVPNLLLAGAHTQTDVDVWSIEAAVESGRRAARAVEADVRVIPQHQPRLLRFLGRIDNLCFALGLPHFLDLALMGMAVAVAAAIVWLIVR